MSNRNEQRRISRGELQKLLDQISERDKAILQALHDYRYLLTGQIQRLYFRQSTSHLAATRATNRCLLRLEGLGLLSTLKRRIGGARAGSASYVWTLTPVAFRLLDLLAQQATDRSGDAERGLIRKRLHEPSSIFLQHTLAVAELAIRLTELAADRKIGLLERQVEPDCWRSYTNAGGTLSTLRPDLYAITVDNTDGATGAMGDYEDHWFIEMDLATESPAVVVRKCHQYVAYLNSGEEQRRSDLFPLVAWVVPDGRRKESLLTHIAENLSGGKRLFVVVTLEEFENLVCGKSGNE
jgi:hypothetical protein